LSGRKSCPTVVVADADPALTNPKQLATSNPTAARPTAARLIETLLPNNRPRVQSSRKPDRERNPRK
jgi:hypothetical protein